MLKRSVIMVLAMLYLTTVSGFALNLHYCFNRLASVKVDAKANSCTKLQSSKMKCCKDQKIEIKVKDAHQNNSPLHWSQFFPIALPVSAFVIFTPVVQNPVVANVTERGPPKTPGIRLFLINNIFRI
ncbi:hypothetical protein [Mucilaginibacter sp. BT774]|uniref:HYC_CC_PP family protein n=1 Tax=Mucilaginibacter sp. BT774 TaxID=3062276 RepID=UPI002677484A|nr:hypothetical protein [Mucilaginibacter sp. BT774]MDO3626656.1 hypothetical protein [Mucilaginibacter sp. BT774]